MFVCVFSSPEGVLNFFRTTRINSKATQIFSKYHGSLRYFSLLQLENVLGQPDFSFNIK